jgi:peptidoglycan/xylan/chitin deacetylase (PgdA/CDA1 family)
MNAEMQLGFRSSFNFVAEDYPVDPKLRETLLANGFAIGLHGLHHDGELFKSRENFERAAPRLGLYLKDWGSGGFHAPSMLSNLEWITELDIEYDCSTFDTDPFEPHPSGVGSVFPLLLVSASRKRGFVELPYTLPQDHCLFVILKEKTIDIWKEKLDWIASLGGMAFLNTHPDYMNFEQRPCDFEEYPVDYYLEFLRYLKTRYAGQYWPAHPKEISRYCQEIAPSLRIIPVQGKGSAPDRSSC